ncbi:MAG TPA: beta-ketoacyl-[acyl-carrier-protein] synthase family protein [Candidatus Acidoferrales bacterium]|nr:beta-ketoacyl-[acyl-carrier-protein] synthase family protein [Candidatus Acidoferrales bacterium]
MRSVVISGIGLVGPTGVGWQPFWSALLEGRSGIDRITRFDTTSYPCQIGGEVRDRSYEELLDPRDLRNSIHASQLALAASELALRDARWSDTVVTSDRFGVSIGTALAGWHEAQQQHAVLLERGVRRVNPFITNAAPHHAPAAEVASRVGARGMQTTFATGCAAGLQAIGHAAAMIASGELDACLAGGTESPLTPLVIAGMGRTQELSSRNQDPTHASRPFDQGHDGIVLSEGSCVFLLESAESAQRRGAEAYVEVLGSTTSCDAAGLYQLDPSGVVAAQSLCRLLERVGLQAGDVDYVCAHANSAPAFDRKETVVIKRAFGEFAARLPISSIKAIIGHPFGAAGAFQTAASCLALRHSVIPPTHNFEVADPECDLDYVPSKPRPTVLQRVLVSSYGYGGVNSYLLLSQRRRPVAD